MEVATGPLGQGFGNGVGMAIAEAWLAAHFNRPGHKIVNHYIYAICGDGDLMEGITQEAASLAGHLKLGKLIYLYDNNHISLGGATGLIFTEDVAQRFEAYGWHTRPVADGNDTAEIAAAIAEAQAESRPSLILVRTHIGYGSPKKQDSFTSHGAPLGEDELLATKKALGWPSMDKFFIPPEALECFRTAVERGAEAQRDWRNRFEAYRKDYPAEAADSGSDDRRQAARRLGGRPAEMAAWRQGHRHPCGRRPGFERAGAAHPQPDGGLCRSQPIHRNGA